MRNEKLTFKFIDRNFLFRKIKKLLTYIIIFLFSIDLINLYNHIKL